MESIQDSSSFDRRRKPLELLSEIFGRKMKGHDEDGLNSRSDEDDDCEDGDGGGGRDLLLIPEPRQALHSPYHAKTIDQDMDKLILSRQDNPFLQVLASHECLYESNESLFEEKHLMSKENVSGGGGGHCEHPLTLAEVHARLVRSPPPIMWTKSRNSEPSFLNFIQGNVKLDSTIFQFPPPQQQQHLQTNDKRQYTTESRTHLLRTSGTRHPRFMESAVEALSARFNLSPQPRRKPKDNHFLH